MKLPELGYLKNIHKNVFNALQSAVNKAKLLEFEDAEKNCRYVSGALHFSRFEGVASVMDNAAEFAIAIRDKTFNQHIEQPVDVFCKVLDSVKQYLLAILANAPDVPIKLWDAYKTVRSGIHKSAHPSHLFFPLINVDFWLPINQNKSFNEKNFHDWHIQFESNLINWAKDRSQTDALLQAKLALEKLLSEQPMCAEFVGFIKTAIAVLDIVSQKTNLDFFENSVIVQINQELKNFEEQRIFTAKETWRHLLYVVAFSQSQSNAVLEVKEKHRLNDYVDLIKNEFKQNWKILDKQDFLLVKETLFNVKNSLENLTKNQSMNSIHNFEHYVKQLSERLTEFNYPPIKRIDETLIKLTHGFKTGNIRLTASLLEEIAVIVLLIEQAMETKWRVSVQFEQNVFTQIKRILAVVNNDVKQLQSLPFVQMDREFVKQIQQSLRISVLTEIKAKMQVVEEILDILFNCEDKNDKDAIRIIPSLKDLTYILRMSNLPEAANVLVELISELDFVFKKNNNIFTESNKTNILSKVAALSLYFEAEIAGQTDALRFLGVEQVQVQYKKDIMPIQLPVYQCVNQTKSDVTLSTHLSSKLEIQEHSASSFVSDEDIVASDEYEMLDTYLEDFAEQLTIMKRSSDALLHDLDNKEMLYDIRRAFHTIKGSGRMVSGLVHLPNASEKIEFFLKKWIDNEKPITRHFVNVINDTINIFEGWMNELSRNRKVKVIVTELFDKFDQLEFRECQNIHGNVEIQREVIIENKTIEPQSIERNVFVGDVTIDSKLYDMYLDEARESVQFLIRAWELTCKHTQKVISKAFMEASHKLGSSSKTVGFNELAKVSFLLERWAERNIESNRLIDQKEIEDIGQLISHAEKLFNAIVVKKRLELNEVLIQQVEAYLRDEKIQVVQSLALESKDSDAVVELKKKIRVSLENEIKSIRAHLGVLESLLMLVDTEK